MDLLMETYAGEEQSLLDKLVSQYGPLPPDGAIRPNCESVRMLNLVVSPEASKPDSFCLDSLNSEPEAPVAAVVVAESPPVVVDWRRLVRSMYEYYAPEKLGQLDLIMETYAGEEEALLEALVTKYGPQPQEEDTPHKSPRHRSHTHSHRSHHRKGVAPEEAPVAESPPIVVDPAVARRLVKMMYEFYAPEKCIDGFVDTILKSNAGEEQSLLDALVTLYGPLPVGFDRPQAQRHRTHTVIPSDTPEAVPEPKQEEVKPIESPRRHHHRWQRRG